MSIIRIVLILMSLCLVGATRDGVIFRGPLPLPEAEQVPLVALLARPADFDGRVVRVEGFLSLRFEGSALYPDRETYEGGLHANSVWVNTVGAMDRRTAYRMPPQYAVVQGRFVASENGHLGMFSGGLTDVQLIASTMTQRDYWKWLLNNDYFWTDPRIWALLALTAAVPLIAYRIAARPRRR